jgi:hypothetical protein
LHCTGKTFPKLRVAAKALNTASDETAKAVSPIESVLKSLNIGVPTWTQMSGNEDDDGAYWSRDVGYAKLNANWGLCIRTTNGHHGYDYHNEEVWEFNEAPRWMRIDAIAKLPDLIEALVTRTEDTAKKIKAKTKQASEIAAALVAAAQAEEGNGE